MKLYSIKMKDNSFDIVHEMMTTMPTCFCEYFRKCVSKSYRLSINVPETVKKKLKSVEKKIYSYHYETIPSIFECEWIKLRDIIEPQLDLPSNFRLLPGIEIGFNSYFVKSKNIPHIVDYSGDILISNYLFHLIEASNLTGFGSEPVTVTLSSGKQTDQIAPHYHLIKPTSKLLFFEEIFDKCPECGYMQRLYIQNPLNENEIWDGSDFVSDVGRVYVSENVILKFKKWGIDDVVFKQPDPESGLIHALSENSLPDKVKHLAFITSINPRLRYKAIMNQLNQVPQLSDTVPFSHQPPVSIKKINKQLEGFPAFILGNPKFEILDLVSCFDIYIDIQNNTFFSSTKEIGKMVEFVVDAKFEKDISYARKIFIIIQTDFNCQLREVFRYDRNIYQIVIWKQYINPSTWDPIKAYQLCEKLSQAFLKAAPCEVRIEGRGVRLLAVESSKVATVEVAGMEPDVATKILHSSIECFEMHIEIEDNPPFPGVDDFLPIIQKVLGMEYREESYMLDSFKYIFEGKTLCCEFNEDYDRAGMTFHLVLCKQDSKRTKWEPLKVYQLCEEMCKGFLDVCPCEVSIVGRGIGLLSLQSSNPPAEE